jgi:hypothetical protein
VRGLVFLRELDLEGFLAFAAHARRVAEEGP